MPAIKIAPSILSAHFGRLEEEVKAIEQAGADAIHIDVMDGHYVPNITIGPCIVRAIREATTLPLDVHLMISEPERYIGEFSDAGADILTIHHNATPHVHRVLQAIKKYRQGTIKAGLALNPGQDYSVISPSLLRDGLVDMVLQMTVNPGFGGQEFIEGALENVPYFRTMFPGLDLQVDGGISCRGQTEQSSAYRSAQAGANVLVAGSAVFKNSDYKSAILNIREAAQQGYANHR